MIYAAKPSSDWEGYQREAKTDGGKLFLLVSRIKEKNE